MQRIELINVALRPVEEVDRFAKKLGDETVRREPTARGSNIRAQMSRAMLGASIGFQLVDQLGMGTTALLLLVFATFGFGAPCADCQRKIVKATENVCDLLDRRKRLRRHARQR